MVMAFHLSSACSLSILHPKHLHTCYDVTKPSSLLTRNGSRITSRLSSLYISNSHSNPHYHTSPPHLPPLDQSVAAVVFGDRSLDSTRLYPLTVRRSESAIPIAANYRLIDVVGSADAIRRCLWVMEEYPVTEFLILPGHHLYRMDYRKLIEAHRNSNADITIAAASSSNSSTSTGDDALGQLEVDSHNQVTAFHAHSVRNPQERKSRKWNGIPKTGSGMFRNMGIYVINREMLKKLLNESFPEALDLGSEVIKGSISTGLKVQAYVFNGFWEDMGSIAAFYRANLECINTSNTCYGFYEMGSPLYGIPRCLPPTTVSGAVITESVIGDGCIINKCRIKGSVVGMRSRIGDRAVIEDSVILGSDIYHYDKNIGGVEERSFDVPIGIGDGTLLRKAVVDKNARIGRNVKIINKNMVEEANRESEGYVIRDGIIVILRGAQILDGVVL